MALAAAIADVVGVVLLVCTGRRLPRLILSVIVLAVLGAGIWWQLQRL